MNIDLDRVAKMAAGEDKITTREAMPRHFEMVIRALKKVPQVKRHTTTDRSSHKVVLDLSDVKVRLDFDTGRFAVE